MNLFKISWIGFWVGLMAVSSAQTWDIKPLYYFQQHRNSFGNATNRVVDFGVYPLTAMEPLAELSFGIYRHDSVLKRKALVNGASVLLAMGMGTLLKYTVNRPRPYLGHNGLTPIAIENTPSFPSGHTTAAFTMATNLTLSFRKWYVVVPAYTYAGIVGFTRIYGGVHYTSDVIVGALLGTSSSLLTHWLGHKIYKRPKRRPTPMD